MRRSRFSEERIIRILGEVEGGRQVKEVCREPKRIVFDNGPEFTSKVLDDGWY
jgi:Transposase